MKLTLSKKELNHAIFRAEKVTGKNLSLQALRGVLLTAEKKTLVARATNLDIGISVSVPAEVAEPGTVSVDGGVFNGFLANSGVGGSVTLSEQKGHLTVDTGRETARINTFPHEDFPTLPSPSPKGKTLTLAAKDLLAGFKSVWYAASVSSMKPELASVFVSGNASGAVFAATDQFRLAEKTVKLDGAKTLGTLLVPVKNVAEIIRTLDEAEGEVELASDENQLEFRVGDARQGVRLVSRLVDGSFPDYAQIIPKEFTAEATALKDDFANALKVSTLFSNKFNQTLFKINPKKKEFVIETRNPEVGESVVSVDAALTGEPLDIGFNHKYIVDAFQSVPTDSVSLKFSGQGKPLVMQGVGDLSFLYLVMPMNR